MAVLLEAHVLNQEELVFLTLLAGWCSQSPLFLVWDAKEERSKENGHYCVKNAIPEAREITPWLRALTALARAGLDRHLVPSTHAA